MHSVLSISQNLRLPVHCQGVRGGGVREWEFAREQHLVAKSAAEKITLVYAMACSENLGALNRLVSNL